MVTIRLKTTLAGPQMTATAGSVIEVAEEFAYELISAGYAVAVDLQAEPDRVKPAPEVEEAVLKAPEKAVGRRVRK